MVNVMSPARPRSPRGFLRRALASDLVDRLTAPHGVDRYLELVDPRWLVRETRAEITSVLRQTEGTVTLTLRPNDTWSGFRAGQHVVVGVNIDGVVHERCFSLASSPHRRRGICGTCTTTKTSGVVRNLVTGQESHADAEPIRLCVSVPCGDVAVDL